MKECCYRWMNKKIDALTLLQGAYTAIGVNMLYSEISDISYCPLCGGKFRVRGPIFNPGDTVMRKDGKKVHHDYLSKVLGVEAHDYDIVLKLTAFADGGGGYVFYPPEMFTLAPEKPDIEGYEVVDFRPPKSNEFYTGLNGVNPMANGVDFRNAVPRWILKKKTTELPDKLGNWWDKTEGEVAEEAYNKINAIIEYMNAMK